MSTEDRFDGLKSIGQEVWDNLTSPRILGLTITIALSAVLMGPFGTLSAMSFTERLMVWPAIVIASVILGATLQCLSFRFWRGAPRVTQIVAEAIVMGLILTPVIISWVRVVAGWDYEFYLSPSELFSVVAFSYAMTAATLRFSDPLPRMAPFGPPDEPRLHARLPERPSAPVAHLAADDHYVEVTLSDGSRYRILLRLADAVEEMNGIDGFCVHRSHWVARSAIAEVIRDNGRDFVTLSTGIRVPVSRTYRPNLVKAGLLEDRA